MLKLHYSIQCLRRSNDVKLWRHFETHLFLFTLLYRLHSFRSNIRYLPIINSTYKLRKWKKKIGRINKKKLKRAEMLWKQFSNVKIIQLRSWYDLINLIHKKYLPNLPNRNNLNNAVLIMHLLVFYYLFHSSQWLQFIHIFLMCYGIVA